MYQVNADSFEDIALQLFRFQASGNPIYRTFINGLGLEMDKIHTLTDIPFLPIRFFKEWEIKTGEWSPEKTFGSSGTTGPTQSRHHVRDLQFYHDHSLRNFEHFFGSISDYHVLALLPSYMERNDSSLVSMIAHFIRKSGSSYSGFYLNDIEKLLKDLKSVKDSGRKTILWGVTFALLDIAEKFSPDLSHCLIFETGGMKGRRKEMIRQELHHTLKQSFNVSKIYSEYGMTEMLSQAYTDGKERFRCPAWLKAIGRDTSDPLEKGLLNENAGINVIDLANWNSISFIETEDVGKVYQDGSFEVLGRFDNSEVRGCNLMVE